MNGDLSEAGDAAAIAALNDLLARMAQWTLDNDHDFTPASGGRSYCTRCGAIASIDGFGAVTVPEPKCPGVISICRDEDCPACGWPETFARGPLESGPDTLGCRKCGWRQAVTQ